MSNWLLFQLADGTFPSGAFAHSGGLEAAMVLGALRDPRSGEALGTAAFLDTSLRQIGRAALPFVRRVVMDPPSLAVVDEICDASLPLLAPNRASRAQGRALASAAGRVWDSLAPIAE